MTKELKKGCGNRFSDDIGLWVCGSAGYKSDSIKLCPECKAELKGYQEAEIEVLAEVLKKVDIMIFSGHVAIKSDEGIITSFKNIEDTSCYVCDLLIKLKQQFREVKQCQD